MVTSTVTLATTGLNPRLTPAETNGLQKRLDAIRGQYERSQWDGRLKDAEIRFLQGKLDSLANSIVKERSDQQRSR